MLKHIRLVVGIFILISSVIVLMWSVLPVKMVCATQLLQPEAVSLDISGRQALYLFPEPYQVTLEWPGVMRIGDKVDVTLYLQPMQAASTLFTTSPGYVDVYDVANVMAEARLELAGVVLEPANPTRVSLPLGNSARFTWEIYPSHIGRYTGDSWLSLRFLPLDGSPAIQVPVYVGEINLHASSLFGLSLQVTRPVGVIGIIIGLALIIRDMVKYKTWVYKMAAETNLNDSRGIT